MIIPRPWYIGLFRPLYQSGNHVSFQNVPIRFAHHFHCVCVRVRKSLFCISFVCTMYRPTSTSFTRSVIMLFVVYALELSTHESTFDSPSPIVIHAFLFHSFTGQSSATLLFARTRLLYFSFLTPLLCVEVTR